MHFTLLQPDKFFRQVHAPAEMISIFTDAAANSAGPLGARLIIAGISGLDR